MKVNSAEAKELEDRGENGLVKDKTVELREQEGREGMEEHKMGREKVEAMAENTETILEHVQKATSTTQEAGTLAEAPGKLSPAENVDLATSVLVGSAMAGELAYKAGKEMMETAADLVDKAKEELKKRFGDRDLP